MSAKIKSSHVSGHVRKSSLLVIQKMQPSFNISAVSMPGMVWYRPESQKSCKVVNKEQCYTEPEERYIITTYTPHFMYLFSFYILSGTEQRHLVLYKICFFTPFLIQYIFLNYSRCEEIKKEKCEEVTDRHCEVEFISLY